jgi:membrane protein YqaA with SNARE-associated domain
METRVTEETEPPALGRTEVALLLLRLIGGLVLLGGVVTFLASHFREQLTALGHKVIQGFGLPGMAVGTVFADGFQFPIPPQFYMLASIAAGSPPVPVLVALAIGSITGGHLGMLAARRARNIPFVRRTVESGSVAALFRRHGPLAVVIGSIAPFPFSIVCYSCGLFRFRYRLFALVCALRIPKLVVFYAIIRSGWSL